MALRITTESERVELASRGCLAESWERVFVDEEFSASQLFACRLLGEVRLSRGATIYNSTVKNYSLSENSRVDSVTLLECDGESTFGNGVEVAALNECGGRSIKIYDSMTAQVAYLGVVHRHRHKLIEQLDTLAENYAHSRRSAMGQVGANSSIVGARIVRNVWVDQDVKIEGSSLIENGTILRGAYFGVDVKARDFIAVESSRVDCGAIVERCFVGESVIIANSFTALDSLFFASSHCENGEAASIFAGPYTVSHHKSSLLIAGMFSFFNAGSGSNQSNHLLKSGPVHQGVHLRGCKFGSSAYVMLPAVDGVFTTVIGSHSSHHDTSDFPFSYLINKEGRSVLIPAANLTSCGYIRDVEKWVKRDKRVVKRDVVSLEQHNPYIVGFLIRATNTINKLTEEHPDQDNYFHNNVMVRSAQLRRALTTYNKSIASAIGSMLSKSNGESKQGEGRGKWLDIGGQYISESYLNSIIDSVESGSIGSLEQIDLRFKEFNASYYAYAYDWALGLLTQLLGEAPTAEKIASTIQAAEKTDQELRALAERDRAKDNSLTMAVSYGIDSDNEQDRVADYKSVRGLE